MGTLLNCPIGKSREYRRLQSFSRDSHAKFAFEFSTESAYQIRPFHSLVLGIMPTGTGIFQNLNRDSG